MYSTDASAYREVPLAVVRAKNSDDLKVLIDFARTENISLIPRTAGTSLAGQVVGTGIVVDVSRYMTAVLEFNAAEHWVRVEPGVILDELNLLVSQSGLFFGPETSTSNRCMIGGMVGNNSCGSHSLVYGSTRDHILNIKALLSDGNEVEFGPLTRQEFDKKCLLASTEGHIYRQMKTALENREMQDEIRQQFPDPELERRNNGYAVDYLLETEPFANNETPFNFCKLITGSEGTLCFYH